MNETVFQSVSRPISVTFMSINPEREVTETSNLVEIFTSLVQVTAWFRAESHTDPLREIYHLLGSTCLTERSKIVKKSVISPRLKTV